MNETEIKNIRKRLLWRATHRGTKEVDLLLGTFAAENVGLMDLNLLGAFEAFMEIADPQMHLIMTKEV
ncbi:MAG: succinate dehydrogenase assembly factor 2, partial [Alphaproteobacteria bacterium]